jgi:peptide/nickel transport system permease protein
MSTITETPSLRDWLLTEDPASRRQAAWGRRFRMWRDFQANPLAMAGLIMAVVLFAACLAAPLLATWDPSAQDLANRLATPSWAHWFGTDELGRDVYSRVLYGGRVTLGMVIAVVLAAAPLGLAVGCVAGYFGGWADRVLMRVTDIFLAFPRLILALAFVAAIKPGITSTVAAIALTAWPAPKPSPSAARISSPPSGSPAPRPGASSCAMSRPCASAA